MLVPATTVGAQNAILDGCCEGVELQDEAECGDNTLADGGINDLLTNVINFISLIVGFVAVVMIIVGGFKYITSGGDSGNVTGAKNTILYAIIGIIIVVLAQLIIRLVVDETGDFTDGAA
jgi:hypothetical protein